MPEMESPMSRNLEDIRTRLDHIDDRIVDDLVDRQRIVSRVASRKRVDSLQVHDAEREHSVLRRVADRASSQGLDGAWIAELWERILAQSRRSQAAGILKVAIQGASGSWSHRAVRQHVGGGAEVLEHAHVTDALRALRTGAADLAVLPIHNAIVGPIREVCRLLDAPDLEAIARVDVPIRHCLATVADVCPEDLTHVHSQQPALDQCQRRLTALGLHQVAAADTAMAASQVAALDDPRHAALCSREAAERHGLTVVDTRVADDRDNLTRFNVVALRPVPSAVQRLSARRHHTPDTVVQVGEVRIGEDVPVIIAGPCSVEGERQLREVATEVAHAGAHLLRGGCYKPRTSPYAFQGLGEAGLELLRRVGQEVGLPVVTEVMAPEDVPLVASYADVLQIGARSMQNTPLLRAVGRADRPVLLKRGMCATVDEWLAAADYILGEGNRDVILCERGIRTFAQPTRNTLDLGVLPVLRERTHLPVLVDPSHAVGVARWIPPMAAAALAAGAHGLMLEVHCDPSTALSDGPQALVPDVFRSLMRDLGPL